MNLPSIKSLMEIKSVTREDAKQIRAILACKSAEGVMHLSDAASEYVRSCYNRPPLQLIKLTAIDQIIGTYGVEFTPAGSNLKSPAIEYLNAGDAYATTLMSVNGRYRVGCWGDIVERGNYA